jgi:hypothetical protein
MNQGRIVGLERPDEHLEMARDPFAERRTTQPFPPRAQPPIATTLILVAQLMCAVAEAAQSGPMRVLAMVVIRLTRSFGELTPVLLELMATAAAQLVPVRLPSTIVERRQNTDQWWIP